MMKIVTLAFLLITVSSLHAQRQYGCDARPALFVASLGVNADISGEAKIGLWQNSASAGFTVFAGILTNVPDSAGNAENRRYITSDRFFFEAGYKFRLGSRLFSHSMLGATGSKPYFGTEILFQADNMLLIGINYKRSLPGMALYFHF